MVAHSIEKCLLPNSDIILILDLKQRHKIPTVKPSAATFNSRGILHYIICVLGQMLPTLSITVRDRLKGSTILGWVPLWPRATNFGMLTGVGVFHVPQRKRVRPQRSRIFGNLYRRHMICHTTTKFFKVTMVIFLVEVFMVHCPPHEGTNNFMTPLCSLPWWFELEECNSHLFAVANLLVFTDGLGYRWLLVTEDRI